MNNLIKNGNKLIKINNKLINNAASSGETWVLNEYLAFGGGDWSYDINFTSNGNSYSKFRYHLINPMAAYLVYGTTEVYNVDAHSWTNEAYRTVIFETTPTDNLLTWLQANGVKQ